MFFSFLLKSFLILFLFSSSFINAKEVLYAKRVASGLNGVVWGMTFISEDSLLVTLKSGEIHLINLETQEIKELKHNIDVLYDGQGGLLDIAASPNFKKDRYVYVTYVKSLNNQGTTTIARAKFYNNVLENFEDLLVSKSLSDTSRHFGSRIAFDTEGHVYFTIGDRGVRPNSQDLSNHAGTTLRLNLDGSVPKNNPFVKNKNILNEIYSFGHRNAQGIYFDTYTQKLFLVEHGPRGGDEINIVEAGLNYGWPVISYGKEYWNPFPVGEGTHKEGMQQPIKVYVPSIAPSSLIVYRGSQYKSLKDKILVSALKLQHINVITLNKNLQSVMEARLFEDLNERIRCITKDVRGFIYFSTDSGNIYMIEKY